MRINVNYLHYYLVRKPIGLQASLVSVSNKLTFLCPCIPQNMSKTLTNRYSRVLVLHCAPCAFLVVDDTNSEQGTNVTLVPSYGNTQTVNAVEKQIPYWSLFVWAPGEGEWSERLAEFSVLAFGSKSGVGFDCRGGRRF